MNKKLTIECYRVCLYSAHPIGFGWSLDDWCAPDYPPFTVVFDWDHPYKDAQEAIKAYLRRECNCVGDIHSHNGFIIAHGERGRGDQIPVFAYTVALDGRPLQWDEFPHVFPDFIHDWNE